MSTGDYYKNLWTTTQGKGAQFFKTVNFTTPPYQYQENIFRAYLDGMILKNEIKSVLELGAGSGRMTKIVMEELNPEYYMAVDLKLNSGFPFKVVDSYREFDITQAAWNDSSLMERDSFDLIIASEVFMHIKPIDIDQVIFWLSHIGKQIINIDWTFDPDPNTEWYFIHDYEKLYEKYGAQKITRVDMKRIQQSLFHYSFDV